MGALPGRIIQGLKQAGTNNPVLLLDEVDKMGADVRGDPSAALLEVLDPEQNHTFRDHYLGVPFDLSRVVFIATANFADSISPPLRDRMETLRLAGYSEEEKLAISERFLVPRQVGEAGLTARDISIGRPVLRKIIAEYTREAGLRELERLIAQLARKVARRVVEEGSAKLATNGASGRVTTAASNGGSGRVAARRNAAGAAISIDDVAKHLGPPKFLPEERTGTDEVGTVNGLAWTPYGGEVLHVEAHDDGRQGLAHPDRAAGRRDEGIGAGGAVVRARAGAGVGTRHRVLFGPRDSHPRSVGRGSQGRPVGGRHDGLRPGVAGVGDSRAA